VLKVLLIVLLLSLAIYGLVRVIERRGVTRRTTKPLAPDDDLDFLRDLDWQQKKDRQRRRKDGTSGPADGGDTPHDPDKGPGNAPEDEDGQGADQAPDGAPDSAGDGATESGGTDGGGASDGGGGGD
jgi:uncharacterized membrane protein YgcG